MGHYSLILEKRYQEFCDVYREKGHLCKTNPGEYGDLQPGSQVRALLAIGEYEDAAQVCRQMIQQEAEESARRGYDARSSIWLIDLSIACMKQGRYAEAAQAIREAPHTNYQPNRIQAPCLMYYMAVVMEDQALKRESVKVLNARLRTKAGAEPAFAPVRFLRDKIDERQLLSETAAETIAIIRIPGKSSGVAITQGCVVVFGGCQPTCILRLTLRDFSSTFCHEF